MRLFFFNDTATTEIYTLSLHDALPICRRVGLIHARFVQRRLRVDRFYFEEWWLALRSEEHTSELQSLAYLVCRLLLEKKKHAPGDALDLLPPAVSPHHLPPRCTDCHMY